MKVGLILFLAKYYHRISIENINSFRHLILPNKPPEPIAILD